MNSNGPKKLRIVVAGGGTGGHLLPGLALIEELKRRNLLEDVIFAGTKYGIENQVVPKQGYRLEHIWIRGFQRSLKPANLIFPIRLVVSLFQSYRLIHNFKPDAVIGTGGYVSGPVLYVAAKMGLPTLIQEQNSYPGVTTRLLAGYAKIVHLSFEESKKYFKHQDNLVVSGNPVRVNFTEGDRVQAGEKFRLDPAKLTLFIFGGSQGAHTINMMMLNLVDSLMAHHKFQILWGTGHNDHSMIQKRCEKYGERISIHPFIDDMAAAYSIADLAICRSGAMTITETALAGVPAIFIPLRHSAAGHQEFNARVLADREAAVMIREPELEPEKLSITIHTLLNDESTRKRMSQRLKEWADPTAAQKIIDSLLELVA